MDSLQSIHSYNEMSTIAVGTPMFNRVSHLEALLDSVEKTDIQQVYVADNGEEMEEKTRVYSANYPFDLRVIDLEYDAGVGACRKALSQEPTEDYLLMVDSDMKIGSDYQILAKQLDACDELGAIGAMLVEDKRIFTGSTDLFKQNGYILKDIRGEKTIQTISEAPLVEFDMIPQAGMFRRECITDYSWDDYYRTQREHIDFFWGQKQHTNWKFAISPTVHIRHNPGGSADYSSHRESTEKVDESVKYFKEKWDCKGVRANTHSWIDTYNSKFGEFPPHSTVTRVLNRLKKDPVDGFKFIAWLFLRRIGLK
jgi:hypothetical protein